MVNFDKVFENLIDEGYEFKTNYYVKEGFELFKKYMGGFIGFFSIFIAFFVGISLLENQYANALANLIQPLLVAGVIIVANEVYRGNSPKFTDFFSGFKLFVSLTLLNIVSSFLIIAGFVLFIIPGIYLAVSYYFANMFVIFFDYDFWPAMELSRKIVTKNWWKIFGFFVIMILINVGGVLSLGIGAIFTLPATACMTYIAFEDIVGGAIRKGTPNQNQHISSMDDTKDNQIDVQ